MHAIIITFKRAHNLLLEMTNRSQSASPEENGLWLQGDSDSFHIGSEYGHFERFIKERRKAGISHGQKRF